MLYALTHLLFIPSIISSLESFNFPNSTCESNNTACDLHGDSFLDSYAGISILECRNLCYDTVECGFITYFTQDGYPLKNFCQLFRSCEKTVECSACKTESKLCFKVGGAKNIVGAVEEENFLDLIPNVVTEYECYVYCRNTPDCTYYTYYLEDDVNYGECILLSKLLAPITNCSTCVTGLTGCAFFTDGVFSTHMKFTEPNIEANVTIPMRPKCQLRLLVVGGGGYAGYGGGGGSGYIQYYTHSTTITSTSAELRISVGNERESSFVVINKNQTIEAQHGHYAGPRYGGDGYSGGGANGCDGGSDGSDGQCFNGGKGTGENVSSFNFDNFQLSAGAAGESSGFYGITGGGGGGILVDGKGPETSAMLDITAGEGYGGGGTSLQWGKPGIVLLEVVPEEFD